MDLVGIEGFVAYLRDAAPSDEDRALRPDLMVRDDAAPEREALRGDYPTSLLRDAAVP